MIAVWRVAMMRAYRIWRGKVNKQIDILLRQLVFYGYRLHTIQFYLTIPERTAREEGDYGTRFSASIR